MPATPARIGFVSQEFRSVVAQDPAVRTRWGEAARDTAENAVETYFDNVADAQLVANQRLNLLKADRRLAEVTIRELLDFSGTLSFTQSTPAMRVIDEEKRMDITGALVAIEALDYEAGRTVVRVWG